MASALQEILNKKKTEGQQESKDQPGTATTPASTGPVSTSLEQAQNPTLSAEELAQREKEAQAVAKQSGAAQTPSIGAVETGMMASIVNTKDHQTEAQQQTQRTEVSTNVDILDNEPRGSASDVKTPNPPNGTLPNSNLILQDDKDSPMYAAADQRAAGLAQLDKANEEAEKWAASEARRQRMLANRPQDSDLDHNEEDGAAPEGGWKATGIKQIAMPNGNWFKAVNGYFVPENEEQTEQLEYFASKGLVEKP